MGHPDRWLTVWVRLPESTVRAVEELAAASETTRGAYIRWMVELLLRQPEALRLFARLQKDEPGGG